MKLKRSIQLQSAFVQTLKDVYSMAESYGFTNDQLTDELNKRIFSKPTWKRLPRQVKEYVHGYRAAMSNNLYWPSKLIVWRHIWNGIAYADWDLCPEECRQAMRDNKGDSAHVWAKFLPVIKRFSTAEKVA